MVVLDDYTLWMQCTNMHYVHNRGLFKCASLHMQYSCISNIWKMPVKISQCWVLVDPRLCADMGFLRSMFLFIRRLMFRAAFVCRCSHSWPLGCASCAPAQSIMAAMAACNVQPHNKCRVKEAARVLGKLDGHLRPCNHLRHLIKELHWD